MRRGRPRHDDILTPREWEVLHLIEAGLTNDQIAERLQINVGTAKYHVAEIMSKLGVSSRWEAVSAARRARSPLLPFVPFLTRGVLTPPVLGGALVAALLALLSVVVFTDLLRDSDSPAAAGGPQDAFADFPGEEAGAQAEVLTRAPARLSSFYYEAASSAKEPDTEPRSISRVKVWYEAPDKWRTEYYSSATGELDSVAVSDGETIVRYDADDGTYESKAADLQTAERVVPAPLLGPMAADSITDYFDDDPPSFYWEVEAEESLHGIETLRIGQFCCRAGNVDQRIGETRYWVDPVYLFLMRIEERSTHTGGWNLLEVTEVEYNPDLSDDVFSFEPPADAREIDADAR